MNGFFLREPNGPTWLLEPILFDLPFRVHDHRVHHGHVHDHHVRPKQMRKEKIHAYTDKHINPRKESQMLCKKKNYVNLLNHVILLIRIRHENRYAGLELRPPFFCECNWFFK